MKKYETQEFNFNMDWRPKPAVTEADKVDKEEGKEEEKTAVENAETDNQKRKEANNNNGKRKKFKKGGKNNDSDTEDDSGDDSNDEAGEGGGKTIYTAKAINLQPGHTGFLTFATLLPKDVFS